MRTVVLCLLSLAFPVNGLPQLLDSLSSIFGSSKTLGIDLGRPVYLKDRTGLPRWLPSGKDGEDTSVPPWGNRTSNNTDPYFGMPDTGVVRKYAFTATRQVITPDGFKKNGLVVNGQLPGPMIEANWGDWIEVNVTNDIRNPEEGFALHWHGLQQRGVPWMDGVAGVSQCGIAPGKSMIYRFRADRYGTSWWHSHYSAQYIDGLTGPMVIHGPDHVDYDVDLGPVLLADLRHPNYEKINHDVINVRLQDIPNIPVLFNLLPYGYSNMINGRSSSNGCSSLENWRGECADKSWQPSAPSFRFQTGLRYKLRLMNVGGDATQRFSIDGHKMTVITTDYTQTIPYETNRVTVGTGQRTDVIVTATGDENGAYFMRANVAWCSLSLSYSTTGAIYYEKADTTKQPKSSANADHGNFCAGDDLKISKPFYAMDADANPATTIKFTNFYTMNATGHLTFTMDFPYTYRGNYSTPLLREVYRQKPISRWKQLYDFGTNSTIRVVINNPTFAQNAHAIHFHGHDMQVIAEGSGQWDGKTMDLKNPTRRDTQIVLPDGHIVFQFKNDNPGIWPLHCHIPWHVADGLVVNLMEDSAKLRSIGGDMVDYMEQTCKDWTEWSKTQNLMDQN